MKNFEFYTPTKIFFGQGRENEIGQILSERNAHKVLIVIGKGSVIKSGLLERVVCSLNQSKIEYVILQGVRANPTFDLVREGIKLVRENNVDYILPIGGGSVIDTAKCIAVSYDYEGDIRDFNARKVTPTHALPIGVILTISAAGSEMSSSCVVQDDETMMKNGFNSDFNRPAFVIENPELTYSVSKEQTAYGIVDIAMHSLERYFYQSEEFELADDIALAVIKNVFDVGLLCFNNPTNYEYRAKIMLDSSLSHNGITHIGKGFSMPVHQLEHALSGLYPNIAHGLGLAVLWPAWAKYYYKYDLDKFAKLGEVVFSIHKDDKEKAALETIERIQKYFDELGMPRTLKALGLKEKDINSLVEIASRKGTRVIAHHSKDMDEEVMRIIYNSCMC